MELNKLNDAVDLLEETILNFPLGAHTEDDFKPIEEKITDLRKSLLMINARYLTLKAMIDFAESPEASLEDWDKSFQKLNKNTSNFLINRKTLITTYQSKAIQDIIYRNEGTKEIQSKVKVCLTKLFTLNDKIMVQNEKKSELMKKQYNLRLKSHHSIYDYKDFLKEQDAKKNQQLEENNPDIAIYREKIDRSLSKIYTMKKLITNLIASMCDKLHKEQKLVDMLAKHKDVVTYETIKETAHNLSLTSN